MNTEPNIKNRVTGALVLIAMAVIFLPLILDGQKKNQILESNIPVKPITGEIVLINLDENSVADKSKDIIEKSNPPTEKITQELSTDKSKVVTKPKVTPIAQSKTEQSEIDTAVKQQRSDRPTYNSSAVVIMVGSFSSNVNASKLVDKLKASGYKAYLKVGIANGKVTNRVLVGPEIKRESAETKIAALRKLSGIKPIILVYDPLIHN